MVLIFSKHYGEISTEEVMDWLFFLGEDPVRFNGEDFLVDTKLKFYLDRSTCRWKFDDEICDKIHAVWYRRSFDDYIFQFESYKGNNKALKYLFRFLEFEFASIYKLFELSLKDVPWLSRRSNSVVNKLEVLQMAAACGLTIPETTIVNSYGELAALSAKKEGRMVTKPIVDSVSLFNNDDLYVSFTVPLDQSCNDDACCFPMLLQSNIDKLFELRIFYLEPEFYSMAIFSQTDEKTKTDFRNYNLNKPNRYVPYKLDADIEKKLRKLMKGLQLETASIDMIYNTAHEHYFLEVNPVGQFGMVSHPCNYYLEKKIAEKLQNKAKTYASVG